MIMETINTILEIIWVLLIIGLVYNLIMAIINQINIYFLRNKIEKKLNNLDNDIINIESKLKHYKLNK